MTIQKIKNKKYVIAGALTLAIAIFSAILLTTSGSFAGEEYWDVKIGEDTVVVLNTEESALEVIDQVENYYVKEGAEVQSIECDPVMAVERTSYDRTELPDTVSVDEAVTYITTGTKEPITYTVKSGDSLWSIAVNHDLTLEEVMEMNKDADLSMIYPGDELKLYEIKPLVTVTTVQKVTEDKQIKFKTETRKSSEVLLNTTVIETKGSYGKKRVTEVLTMSNGEVTDSEVLSSKVLKKAKKQVVVKGTGVMSAPRGTTYQGNGQEIAQYALKYVGNPYVYGGSSLTGGADCSGFVLAVYKHFGITMSHDATAMRSYGKEVSLGSAQPGDLVCHYGHVGIYVGGGMIVHAVNEGMGIAVTSASYTGPVVAVRRIVE